MNLDVILQAGASSLFKILFIGSFYFYFLEWVTYTPEQLFLCSLKWMHPTPSIPCPWPSWLVLWYSIQSVNKSCLFYLLNVYRTHWYSLFSPRGCPPVASGFLLFLECLVLFHFIFCIVIWMFFLRQSPTISDLLNSWVLGPTYLHFWKIYQVIFIQFLISSFCSLTSMSLLLGIPKTLTIIFTKHLLRRFLSLNKPSLICKKWLRFFKTSALWKVSFYSFL